MNNTNTVSNGAEKSPPDYQVAANELAAFYDTLELKSEISGEHASIDNEDERDGKGWAHVAVTVTFTRSGGDNGHGTLRRASVNFSTSYKMGVGLINWKKVLLSVLRSSDEARDIEATISHSGRLIPAAQALIAGKHLSAFVKRVSPAEVLASLCRDGLDASGQSFESWASEYGYDTDSRKAEEMYRNCQRAGGGVCKLLSHVPGAMKKLAELSGRL